MSVEKILDQKRENEIKEYEKEVGRLLFNINTNDVEILCESPENINTYFDMRVMTPMVTFSQITGRDLGKVTCSAPNGKNKINIIKKILKYKIDSSKKENIIISLNNSKYYFEDAVSLERFILEEDSYRDNTDVTILSIPANGEKYKELRKYVNEIINKNRRSGTRTIFIVPDEIGTMQEIYSLDAIYISGVWTDVEIRSRFSIKINSLVFETNRTSKGGSTFKDGMILTRKDLMIWEFALRSGLTGNDYNKLVDIQGLAELQKSIFKLDKLASRDYLSLLFNIRLEYGYIKVTIDINDELTNRDLTYYNVNYAYIPYKSEVTPAPKAITEKTCMANEYKTNIFKGAKGEKNLAPGPITKSAGTVNNQTLPSLEKVYEDLLKEYVQVTKDTPTDREARHAILAMIKDVKEMMKEN